MKSPRGDGKLSSEVARMVLITLKRWAFASAIETRWAISSTPATCQSSHPISRAFGVDSGCRSLKRSIHHEIRTLAAADADFALFNRAFELRSVRSRARRVRRGGLPRARG